MKTISDKNDIILRNADCFDLTHTFECGQCFRWNKIADNEYIGVAFGKVCKISKENDSFRFCNTTAEDFENIWKPYFDFDFDYKAMQNTLSADPIVKSAIANGGGIRILRQDLFETIISFIISANNNIPRIKLIVERFCSQFGKELPTPFGTFYTFPTPKDVSGVSLGDLAFLKAGFRDKYIKDAIDKISSGELDLYRLQTLSAEEAKSELLKIKGVGEKVANCILLFSLHKCDAFPIDVWVKRVMSKYYFGGKEPDCDLAEFARQKFGEYCGFAQQYLFYHARETKLD